MLRWLRDGDCWAGAALAALGLMIVLISQKWTFYGADGPGPGMFPTFYGTAIIVLSLMLIFSRVSAEPDAPKASSPEERAGVRLALTTWAVFALAIALMGVLGFTISFALFTVFLVIVVFGRTWIEALITAVVTAAVFHLIFPVLLGLELPVGMIGL